MTVTTQVATLQSEPREMMRGQLAVLATPVAPVERLGVSPAFVGPDIELFRHDGTWEASAYVATNEPVLNLQSMFVVNGEQWWIGSNFSAVGFVYRFTPGDEEPTLLATLDGRPNHSAKLTDGTILVATERSPSNLTGKIFSSAAGWAQVSQLGFEFEHVAAASESWEVGGFSDQRMGAAPGGYWFTNEFGVTSIYPTNTSVFAPIDAIWSHGAGTVAILPSDGSIIYQYRDGSAPNFWGFCRQQPGTSSGSMLRGLSDFGSTPDYLPIIATHVDNTFGPHVWQDVLFMGGGIGAGRVLALSSGSHDPSVTVWTPGLGGSRITGPVNDAWQDLWEVDSDTGDLTHVATLPHRGMISNVSVGDDGLGVPLIFVDSFATFGTFPSAFQLHRYDLYELHGNDIVHAVDTGDPFNNGGWISTSSTTGSFGSAYAFPGEAPPPRGVAQPGVQVGKLHADP